MTTSCVEWQADGFKEGQKTNIINDQKSMKQLHDFLHIHLIYSFILIEIHQDLSRYGISESFAILAIISDVDYRKIP